MSTVATTRASLTQHALSSALSSSSPPPSVIAVNSSASASPTTPPPPLQVAKLLPPHSHSHAPIFEQLCALRRQRVDMHPDCMLLQAHGVTSPRLSPGAAALTGEKSRRPSTPMEAAAAEETEEEISEAVDSADEMDVVGDNDDDDGDVRSHKMSELEAKAAATRLGATPHCEVEVDAAEEDVEEDDDALSLCSEDSELSVGQEGGSGAASGCHPTPSFCDFNQQRRLLLSNVGNMMALCAPSAFSSVHAPSGSACGGDGSDARSSASTDENTMQQLDDESVGSGTGLTMLQQPAPPPLQPGTAMLDPYVVANALRMPVPMLPRAAPTHAASFQTEFMRKSHMYAEELVKQQMQFMAAARVSAFTLRGASTSEIVAAEERRAFARVQGASQQMSNLAGIQSQLTAITKMSQLSAAAAAAAVAVAAVANNNQPAQHSQHPQLQQHKVNFPNNADALSKLSALSTAHTHLPPTSASATAAVSSLSQLQAQMQAHFPYAHSNHANNSLNNNNNNLNEPALKFSIDNILKADFGRRLAEGAACMAAYNSGTRATKTYGSSNSTSALLRARKAAVNTAAAAASAGANGANSAIAIDLTHLSASSTVTTTTPSTATLNFSHTLANICTNSSDSNSTAVSSSYGGAASEYAKSPGAAGAPNGDFSASAAKSASAAGEESNGGGSSGSAVKSSGTGASGSGPIVWPAWVYCTRYSDRPSSGMQMKRVI